MNATQETEYARHEHVAWTRRQRAQAFWGYTSEDGDALEKRLVAQPPRPPARGEHKEVK